MCYYPFFPGGDLPDDDYTTLVPKTKPTNSSNQNPSKIKIVIEDKENSTTSTQGSSKKKINNRRKTITDVPKSSAARNYYALDYTRSAPSSPAISHSSKRRSIQKKRSLKLIENETKSVSGDYSSLSINGPNNSLASGTLEIRLKYDAKNNKMWIFVVKATLEMNQQSVSNQTLVQIHLTVLPTKRIRYRTRVKPIDNAMFAEEFFCKVSPETIQTQGIRFRLYTYERFKREKLLAEATVMFAMVNLDEDMCKIVPLKRAYPSQDSDLGSQKESTVRSEDGKPELEIGLAYDRKQSLLILEIGKGLNIGMTSQGRPPDTYVQIKLSNSNGDEIVTNRTSIQHGQYHPVYAERYPYNIQENFLEQITLEIAVMNKKSSNNKTDQIFGSVTFGHISNGNEQMSHWKSMLDSQGETITKWHVLLDK